MSYKGKNERVTLYIDRIKAGRETRPITPSLSATVESAGSMASRGTPGAAATMGGFVGLLFKQSDRKHRKYDKKHYDKRELYLHLEDSDWGTVIQCSPDAGLKVREIAHQINLAARLSAATAPANHHIPSS